MTYQRGQAYPLDYRRGITHGPDIPPEWYVLEPPPQRELFVREHFKMRGIYSFFPSEEKHIGPIGRRVKIEKPLVTRMVFTQFRQAPQWDVMIHQRRLISRVYSINGHPIKLGRETIRHLQGLTVDAKRLEEERKELMRLREGDRAEVTEGLLKGWLVDIESVRGGTAFFTFLNGGKGSAKVETLERQVKDT